MIALLQAHGLQAAPVLCGPSEIVVMLDGCELLLTRGFNVDGWEAAVDTGGDQYGVADGPQANAHPAEVVAWVLGLVATGLQKI